MKNRQWFALHGWLGINLGYLLLVICLSGTIATLSSEIDWMLDPALRNSVPTDANVQILGMQDYYEVARRHYPEGEVTLVRLPPEAYLPVQVMVSEAGRDAFLLHLDRYTGDILAERSLLASKNFFRIFHKQFFVVATPFSFHGLWVVGLFGLVLLVSVLSALSFMKSWLARLTRLHWKKGLRVFFAEWHRSTGLWALLFSLLFALTGLWYWIELASDLGDIDMPEASQHSLDDYGAYLPEPDIGRYIEVAMDALPGFEPTTLLLPNQPGGAVHIMGQAGATLVRDAANRVTLNPVDASVIALSRTDGMGAVERWVHTADPLHFGNFAGLWLKVVWFVFGLLISLSIWVGFKLWLMRMRALHGRGSSPGRGPMYVASGFTVGFLFVATLFTVAGIGRMESGKSQEVVSLGTLSLGPWAPELRARRAVGDDLATLQLVFPRVRPNFDEAYVEIGQGDDYRRLSFTSHWQDIRLEEPIAIDQQARFTVAIQSHGGASYRHTAFGEDVLRATSQAPRVLYPAQGELAVKFLVYGFLACIWLGLVFWIRAQFRAT